MVRQDVLFSQACIAETGLWCELAPGIDPVDWARICRFLGHLRPDRFQTVCAWLRRIAENEISPPQPEARVSAHTAPSKPLVSLGPSGLGGPYQREW